MQKTSFIILVTGIVAAGMWGIGDYLGRKGEEHGDVTRGQSIAEQTCLRCHTKFDGTRPRIRPLPMRRPLQVSVCAGRLKTSKKHWQKASPYRMTI